ncbi:NAD(P)-binding protein [Athelia psychrophila]|uniref:NAD(P)-binding protein n=1 Tax=Athelia psychrophila TaxID=1759441 RepID=A0A166X1X8_9AGAM|nr:NAD(P)-binding protein [Fibularhizoctonia sp. CBS 109695]
MVNYHALTSSLNLSGTNVVVVGGTHGIGAAIATRFAELGSSVLIMGRNESAGNAIVSAMRNAARTEAKLAFVRADLGTVKAIRKAPDDIAAWAGAQGVDYLIQCQGGPRMGIWPPTRESATIAFNVQLLSHFLIPYLLLSRPQPVLRQGARISNIMRPGAQVQVLDLDDPMGLNLIEKGKLAYLKNIRLGIPFMADLFTEEFNRRFPQVHTMHVYPGSVATNFVDSFGWLIRLVYAIFSLFAQSPEAYADVAVWQHASDEWKARGWAFFNHKGREVTVDKRVTEEGDDGIRAAVWAKMLELSDEKQL